MTFVPPSSRRQIGKVHPEKLYGTGNTKLQQDAPLGEQEISSGDTLEILFAPVRSAVVPGQTEAMGIASAVQTGNVVIHDRAAAKPGSTAPASVTNGTAERASYDGQSQILTLTGGVHLDGENGSLVAPTVSLNQTTQDAEASGGVQATFQNASSKTPNPSSRPEPVTHVLAARAHFDHATRFATFYGTDAAPARMWQDASQVQAATLSFDGIKRTFERTTRQVRWSGPRYPGVKWLASEARSASSPAQYDPRRLLEVGLQRFAARGDLLRRRHHRWHDGRSAWTTCRCVPHRCSCSARNKSRDDLTNPTKSV